MVVGLVEVTVVEPMSKVVLVVDEKRQVATCLTFTGQWAKSARMLGNPLAPADPGVPVTKTTVAPRTAVVASVARRRRRRAVDRSVETAVPSTISPPGPVTGPTAV